MGTPHNKYEPEFRMMVAKKVVLEGMTAEDAAEFFHLKAQQRANEWATRYIETGDPNRITGEKTKMEIERDMLLWKAATFEYRARKWRAEADNLNKKIKAGKTDNDI